MKKILALILLTASFAQAQYTIKGTLTSTLDTDWIILYKVEGAKQKFIQNTTIKKDSVLIDGKKQLIGNFKFEVPVDTKIGAYRINYRTNGPGSVDFIFNREDINFTFHPDYPKQSPLYAASKENMIYKNYLDEISLTQRKLDSVQITALQNPELDLKLNYITALENVNKVQEKYIKASEELYVQAFIKANSRSNPKEIKTTVQGYMSHMKVTFFDFIDFSNKTLLNSPFLVDRITDYIFYINYSEDAEMQQKLYQKSLETIFSKIKNTIFKRNVIEFLIGEFEETKNIEMIDFLFENYYNKLPASLQNNSFKKEKLSLLVAAIGRIAPNFSWNERGKNLQLSTLNDAENYVLVFWSTGCSHCLKEIPQLHSFLQNKTAIKVVAFSLENNDFDWKNMKATLPNWHHVLGLNKWENKIARTYNINSTPTYIVLDSDKKIIAKPRELNTLKALLDKL